MDYAKLVATIKASNEIPESNAKIAIAIIDHIVENDYASFRNIEKLFKVIDGYGICGFDA